MNPGKWIFFSFVLFAVFIAALVVVCMREDVSLVSQHYYQEELLHEEQQADRLRAIALPEPLRIAFDRGTLQLQFPGSIVSGQVVLQRPSDERFDVTVPLTGDAQQGLTLASWEPGLYRISVTWQANGQTYRVDQNVTFP